jgi:hypothetical protein
MFSETESILTDEILQAMNSERLPIFNSENIQLDIEEAGKLLSMFSSSLNRPSTNIIGSMYRYIPGVLSTIYGI